MKEETHKLLTEPFILEILKFCDGKNNIQDISKKIDLSYRSTFFKVKSLKENNIIYVKNNFLSINENIRNEINHRLELQEHYDNLVKESLSNKNITSIVLKYLEELKDKRFLTFEDSLPFSKEFQKEELYLFLMYLDIAGYTRTRKEITRKGRKFLEQLNQNENNI